MNDADSRRSGGKSEGKDETAQVYRLEYNLAEPGKPISSEAGEASFHEDVFTIKGTSGKTLSFPVREIADFEAKDYRVAVRLQSGAMLDLYYLGYQYEDFVKMLTLTRNRYIKQDLLFHEKLLYTAESINYLYFSDKAVPESGGECDAQVSETALVLAEPGGNHIKFPISYVDRVLDEDYTLKVLMETGDIIALSMLGRQREPLLLNIEKAIKTLLEQALLLCRDLFPGTDESSLKRLSVLFKDGRAVSKASLDDVSPGLWEVMEKRLEAYGIAESYNFLKQSGDIGQASIGLKRGLMGELTGEYVWFLIPVKASGKWMIAMEAGMSEGSVGRATYFYSLPAKGPDYSAQQAANFIRLLNYNLLMVNFRREPIYLSDEMLGKPAYQQYRYAIEKLPSLRLLRSLFAGRVVHSSEEGWKREVARILGMA